MFELKGLIIDSPHIEHILAGRKRWEMRAVGTRRRGTIALIRRDSGAVVGVADLIDSLGPLTENELLATGALHLIPSQRLRVFGGGETGHGAPGGALPRTVLARKRTANVTR